jgi:hypothetical protein
MFGAVVTGVHGATVHRRIGIQANGPDVARPGRIHFVVRGAGKTLRNGVRTEHAFQISGYHGLGPALLHQPAGIQQYRAIAQLQNRLGGMRDEKDRGPPLAQFSDAAKALALKSDVPDRQGLVHDQDVRPHVNGHAERKPDIHAAGIGPDRTVKKLSEFREFDNGRQILLELLHGDAHDRGIQARVLVSRELGMEACAEFQQRRDAPFRLDVSPAGMQGAGDDLQQRGFSRTVAADDAEGFAAPHLQIHVL